MLRVIAWDEQFASVKYDVEAMWSLLKTKIESGVKCYIPLTLSLIHI